MEMTKIMKETVREAILEFDYSFENGCERSIFNKRYELAEKRFNRVFQNMISDLASVEALGFIDCYEKRELINELQKVQRETSAKHKSDLENRLGEKEYVIQYFLYCGWSKTREEAEEAYKEWC